MNRSLLRPAFFAVALLSALALASRAQQDAAAPDAPKESPKEAVKDVPKGDAAPAAPEARDFSGKYLAEGTSNGGRKYKAMVEITREGDVYQVVWVLGPSEGYSGVGIIEGDALCVGWSIGQIPGVVVYKPDTQPDSKKLVGRWTAPGTKGKTFTETLTPLP